MFFTKAYQIFNSSSIKSCQFHSTKVSSIEIFSQFHKCRWKFISWCKKKFAEQLRPFEKQCCFSCPNFEYDKTSTSPNREIRSTKTKISRSIRQKFIIKSNSLLKSLLFLPLTWRKSLVSLLLLNFHFSLIRSIWEGKKELFFCVFLKSIYPTADAAADEIYFCVCVSVYRYDILLFFVCVFIHNTPWGREKIRFLQ